MVTVDKLKIKGFGRFTNQEFSLSPGLNVIYGGNEAGKSTIHGFIEAMLFDLYKPNLSRKEKEANWERFKPWQDSEYGGELEYTWSGGKALVKRDFLTGGVTVIDRVTGKELDLPLNSWGQPDFAQAHFKCSKLMFRNTISISQLGSATDSAVAEEVLEILSNLTQSGGSGISVQQAQQGLEQARANTNSRLDNVKQSLLSRQEQLARVHKLTQEAAALEVEQFKGTQQIENLQRERRRLRDLLGKVEGQAALEKLERLGQLRRTRDNIFQSLTQFGNQTVDKDKQNEFQEISIELEKAKELYQVQRRALEEGEDRLRSLEAQVRELSAYDNYDKDTLIEMSSAWQMLTKGQQVMEEQEQQLESLSKELKDITVELSGLPYFRPDTLEQAATLQVQAKGSMIQDSREEFESELDALERSINWRKAMRGVMLLSMPAVAAIAWVLDMLYLGGLALPLLGGAMYFTSDLKKINLKCRNLRRQIYTLDMEFQNSQRQREQAQRELATILSKSGVESMGELESQYNKFARLSDRNRELLREQKYLSGKLENYRQETQEKDVELQQILKDVGLANMPMDQALALFRHNMDRLLETRTVLDQCQKQQVTAKERLEETRIRLNSIEDKAEGILKSMGAHSGTELKSLVEKYEQKQQLERDLAATQQRIDDLLAGISEEELRAQAATADDWDSKETYSINHLAENLETLEQEILALQTNKSEAVGRLKGIYNDFVSPAQLEEDVWQLKRDSRELEANIQALDMAIGIIKGLAQDLNRQLAPELNLRVSQLVERITAGRYKELEVGRDMSITVTPPDHQEQVSIGRLSGGTMDQFYFACRVAMADLVTDGDLPLFLDDSFVQYDDTRLRYMLTLLTELGKTRQIILFTCQQRELDQLAAVASNEYNLVNLEV